MYSLDLSTTKSVDLELTTRCNLTCKYCYLGSMADVPRKDMSPFVMADCLDLLARITACSGKSCRVFFYGGEPLAAFDAMQNFVHQAEGRKLNVTYGIVSNGTIATPEMVAWCKARKMTIQRSIDGCPAAQEHHRPGTTAAYERATTLWQDYDKTRRMTVTPETAGYLMESLRYFVACGFQKGLAPIPDEYADWTPAATATLLSQLRQLAEEYVRDAKAGKPFWTHWFEKQAQGLFGHQRSSAGCGAGRGMFGITYEGLVVPCHRFSREPADSPMVLGTVRQLLDGTYKGFGLPWAERMQQVRRGAEADRPECVGCIARYGCTKGCYHACWGVNRDLARPTAIYCAVQQEAARLVLRIDKQLRTTHPNWWQKSNAALHQRARAFAPSAVDSRAG